MKLFREMFLIILKLMKLFSWKQQTAIATNISTCYFLELLEIFFSSNELLQIKNCSNSFTL